MPLVSDISAAHAAAKRRDAALKAWDKRGRGQQEAKPQVGGGGAPGVSRTDFGRTTSADEKYRDVERNAESSRAVEKKNLGGGISESYKMTLEDGTKGCFKPSRGEKGGVRTGINKGQAAEREAAAWEVAKLGGMDDLVAPCVVRHDPVHGKGSFAVWQQGEVAANLGHGRYDGPEDLKRAAVFDYVIGNQDRHGRNWLVNEQTGKLRLIDHGLAFGASRIGWSNRKFTQRCGATFGQESVAAYAAKFVANKNPILDRLRKMGLPDAAIARVGKRIDAISRPTTTFAILSASKR